MTQLSQEDNPARKMLLRLWDHLTSPISFLQKQSGRREVDVSSKKQPPLFRARVGEFNLSRFDLVGIAQAEGEIELSADIFDYYADHGEKFLVDKVLNPEFGKAIIRSNPIGVLLGVMPWNFPF